MMNSERHLLISVLNKHSHTKSKILRVNHIPYMSKTLCKAVMRRSLLETKYFKTKNTNSFKAHEKRSFLQQFMQNGKEIFLRNLNLALVTDDKNFLKVVKP